jgi:phenylacetic acid degradation operon negative regulatory protein
MSSSLQIQKAVAGLVKTHKFSPKAIISTIFGDMIVPHGDSVWLGSLVEAGKQFGIKEAHARTSILRLSYEGWLHGVRVGKLSYYTMAEESLRDYLTPIYGTPNNSWSGDWFIFFTGAADMPKQQYVKLRQALIWEGVGQLAPHVFVSLSPEINRVTRVLEDFGLADQVQVLKAHALAGKDPELVRKMVRDAWAIADIERKYDAFLKRYRPIKQTLDRSSDAIDPESSFVIRALLILEFRVIALRDPHLPSTLMPSSWSGHAAFTLCKNLYQQVLPGSEAYLASIVRTLDGPFKPAGPMLWSRFGGLTKVAIPG